MRTIRIFFELDRQMPQFVLYCVCSCQARKGEGLWNYHRSGCGSSWSASSRCLPAAPLRWPGRGRRLWGFSFAGVITKRFVWKMQDFPGFPACRISPRNQTPSGRILYLHGGGYTCGGLEYAKGFGSVLASITGAEVLCPAYRLAPEHPFPAGLEDGLTAYKSLLEQEGPVVLCGESAGGGLIYALCLLAKTEGLPLPAGLIGISPWTDLTASGSSYETNRDRDPSITLEQLDFFASCYTTCRDNPLASPLFGDFTGFPPSLLFVGGDEILLDDSRLLHEKLLASGCSSTLRLHQSCGMLTFYTA